MNEPELNVITDRPARSLRQGLEFFCRVPLFVVPFFHTHIVPVLLLQYNGINTGAASP